jgi:uncharacterized membrane protein YoaK (UPF0700 family)
MALMISSRAAAALALTGVAGYVDALGYLSLFHVYTANMSGNSIAIGTDAARGDWGGAAFRALPVIAFFAGLLIASVMIEFAKLRGMRRTVSLALSVEIVCLLSVAQLATTIHPTNSSAMATLMVALAAVAMGAQNASLRDAGVLDVYTTHVTGTLTMLARDLARRWFARPVTGPPVPLLAALWVIYVFGAVGGGFAWLAWLHGGPRLSWIAICVVAAVLVLDLIAPLSPREA